jgi:ribosome-associated protein
LKEIQIQREPAELYKLLKFEGLASSGGEAKAVIAGGLVKVNGEVETRKRKKITAGDIVEFAGEKFHVQLIALLLAIGLR